MRTLTAFLAFGAIVIMLLAGAFVALAVELLPYVVLGIVIGRDHPGPAASAGRGAPAPGAAGVRGDNRYRPAVGCTCRCGWDRRRRNARCR